jgi:ABC-type anion transport system duplicated permease subunit
MGKWIIIAGAVLIAVGILVWLAERAGFRGLPGDVRYEGQHVRVYFPIVSSIALSILLTLILWLIQWFNRR